MAKVYKVDFWGKQGKRTVTVDYADSFSANRFATGVKRSHGYRTKVYAINKDFGGF